MAEGANRKTEETIEGDTELGRIDSRKTHRSIDAPRILKSSLLQKLAYLAGDWSDPPVAAPPALGPRNGYSLHRISSITVFS